MKQKANEKNKKHLVNCRQMKETVQRNTPIHMAYAQTEITPVSQVTVNFMTLILHKTKDTFEVESFKA